MCTVQYLYTKTRPREERKETENAKEPKNEKRKRLKGRKQSNANRVEIRSGRMYILYMHNRTYTRHLGWNGNGTRIWMWR